MISFGEYFLVCEGGNIFKGATRRINKEEVLPTVRNLEKKTGLNLLDNLLGSTGKTETSGDIDLCVDENILSKDNFIRVLMDHGGKLKEDIVRSGIQVSYKAPIFSGENSSTGEFVQADFMFTPDCEYLKWFCSSNESPPFKGSDKNILLSSIASRKGLTLSMKGLSDKSTESLISMDPKKIVKMVFGDKATLRDVSSVDSIIKYLLSQHSAEEVKEMVKDAEKTTGLKFL